MPHRRHYEIAIGLLFGLLLASVIGGYVLYTSEQRARMSRADLSSVISATDKAVVLTVVEIRGDTGLIVVISGAAERLFGWGRNELIGLPIDILVAPDHRDKFNADIIATRTQSMTIVRAIGITKDNSKKFPVIVSTNRLSNNRMLAIVYEEIDLEVIE